MVSLATSAVMLLSVVSAIQIDYNLLQGQPGNKDWNMDMRGNGQWGDNNGNGFNVDAPDSNNNWDFNSHDGDNNTPIMVAKPPNFPFAFDFKIDQLLRQDDRKPQGTSNRNNNGLDQDCNGLAVLRKRIDDLEKENAKLKAAAASVNQLRQKINALEGNNRKLADDFNNLKNENANLRNSNSDLTRKNNDLLSQLADLNRKLAAKDDEINRLKANLADLPRIKSENDSLRADNQNLQKSLGDARKTLAVQNAQLNDLYRRIEDLNAKLSKYSKQIDDLTNQLNNKRNNKIGGKNISLTVGFPQQGFPLNNNANKRNYGPDSHEDDDKKNNNDDIDIDQILKKYNDKPDNNADSVWDDRRRPGNDQRFDSDIFIGSGLN